VIPSFIANEPRVTVHRIPNDSGPATKFIPAIERELDEGRWDSIIVIGTFHKTLK